MSIMNDHNCDIFREICIEYFKFNKKELQPIVSKILTEKYMLNEYYENDNILKSNDMMLFISRPNGIDKIYEYLLLVDSFDQLKYKKIILLKKAKKIFTISQKMNNFLNSQNIKCIFLEYFFITNSIFFYKSLDNHLYDTLYIMNIDCISNYNKLFKDIEKFKTNAFVIIVGDNITNCTYKYFLNMNNVFVRCNDEISKMNASQKKYIYYINNETYLIYNKKLENYKIYPYGFWNNISIICSIMHEPTIYGYSTNVNTCKYVLNKFIFCDNFFLNICDDYTSSDFIFLSSSIDNIDHVQKIFNDKKKYNYKIIGYIAEPIEHCYKLFYDMYKLNVFDYITGCINNDIEANKIKYPYYMNYFNYTDKNLLLNANNYVKKCNIDQKKFCTLIASHDRGRTREQIFNMLNDISKVDSCGNFLNNMPNSMLETIGNIEFIKQYIFNLCPVNFKCIMKGYIVEKLLFACLGGAIPIYYGEIDEIDEKIFNRNRIIIYDPFDEKSIINACNFIRDLYSNKIKLLDFYSQPIFCDDAYDVLMYMHNNFKNIFQLKD